MGCHPNVGHDRFPRQGSYAGRRVAVVFGYDTSIQLRGEVVREDAEDPGRMIIRLDDGRYVLSTECQWRPLREGEV